MNKLLDSFFKLPQPDDSPEFFQRIKVLSESYWTETDINPKTYGYQIQKDSKWNPGLSEDEIIDFEKALNLRFSPGLRNFYRTMNGLDRPGINVYGSEGHPYSFNPMYYSFPADVDLIKEKINWILEENGLTYEQLEQRGIPKIFPVTGHRFIILDQNNQILSMHGDDIIFWADSLSKLVATDIFDNIYNISDFESNPQNAKPVAFWLE